MARLEFFFDCSSPWTHLGFHRVQPLAAEAGAELVWRPILVGGVFNSVNESVYEQRAHPVPIKLRYYGKDLRDWPGSPVSRSAALPCSRSTASRRCGAASSPKNTGSSRSTPGRSSRRTGARTRTSLETRCSRPSPNGPGSRPRTSSSRSRRRSTSRSSVTTPPDQLVDGPHPSPPHQQLGLALARNHDVHVHVAVP